MKIAKEQFAQGDVYLRRVDAVPPGHTAATPSDGVYVAAHSETGHHHVVDATQAILYEGPNPLVAYLQLAEDCDAATVTHRRDYHTHAPVALTGGPGAVWEVRRQREYTSQGLRRAQD